MPITPPDPHQQGITTDGRLQADFFNKIGATTSFRSMAAKDCSPSFMVKSGHYGIATWGQNP